MGIKGFEQSLENMVEGVFARVFRSGLRPIELGRRLVRELDDHRSIDVKGRTIVPNAFTFSVSQRGPRALRRDRRLADPRAVRRRPRARPATRATPSWARSASSWWPRTGSGPAPSPSTSRMKEGPGGVGAGSLLLPNGERVILGDRTLSIGRLPECDIVIPDTNVSRRHAEIRPTIEGFSLVDLGSTNGSQGQRRADSPARAARRRRAGLRQHPPGLPGLLTRSGLQFGQQSFGRSADREPPRSDRGPAN